jgi:hypothetical protein
MLDASVPIFLLALHSDITRINEVLLGHEIPAFNDPLRMQPNGYNGSRAVVGSQKGRCSGPGQKAAIPQPEVKTPSTSVLGHECRNAQKDGFPPPTPSKTTMICRKQLSGIHPKALS